MSVLAIDPGLHACGCAVFDTSTSNDLVWAGLVKNRSDAHIANPTYHSTVWRGMIDSVESRLSVLDYAPDRLAIELPQVYVASRSKGDPNDLILLAGLVGAFVHWFGEYGGFTFLYQPHSWKGSVPKEIMTARILKHLSDNEITKIEKAPKSLIHNTLDGIGVGLHHLKRL